MDLQAAILDKLSPGWWATEPTIKAMLDESRIETSDEELSAALESLCVQGAIRVRDIDTFDEARFNIEYSISAVQ